MTVRNNRNEATGGIIASGIKGQATAYEEGWDRIFGNKARTEWFQDYNNPRILVTQAEVDEVNALSVLDAFRVEWKIGDTCYWRRAV
jgi:hypothetical protein